MESYEEAKAALFQAVEQDFTKEERQLNAVYACYGAAAQHAQHFEAALAELLIVYNKLTNKSLTPQEFEAMEVSLQKRTMGDLLKNHFRKVFRIHDFTVEGLMDSGLNARNYLMHNFLREREQYLGNEDGRFMLLTELTEIGRMLESATDLTNGMRVATVQVLEGTRRPVSEGDSLFSLEIQVPDPPTGTGQA